MTYQHTWAMKLLIKIKDVLSLHILFKETLYISYSAIAGENTRIAPRRMSGIVTHKKRIPAGEDVLHKVRRLAACDTLH